MSSYMPALTPVIVRQRNNSRLFATPTPDRRLAALKDSDDNESKGKDEEVESFISPPFSPLNDKPEDGTTPTAAHSSIVS